MKRPLVYVLVVTTLPAFAVSLLFYFLLGYRRDYLGHYAAGYGGTLCATMIVLAAIQATQIRRNAFVAVVLSTILCIAAGTVAEATVFRLAKFDEIDFCNQSLGAVLAGLVVMFLAGDAKQTDTAFRSVIAIGASFLIAGFYFAFT